MPKFRPWRGEGEPAREYILRWRASRSLTGRPNDGIAEIFPDWRQTLAKKRGRPAGSKNRPRIEKAAETVGSTLGALMFRVDAWMKQRDQLAADLRAMADNIASGALNVAGAVMQAGTAAAGKVTGAKKRPTMSAEARERIAAAQRARWAKQKAAAGTATSAKAARKANKSAKKGGVKRGNR